MAGDPSSAAASDGQVLHDAFGVKVYENGAIHRPAEQLKQSYSITDLPPDPHQLLPTHGALFRDVVIDRNTGVWVRLYIPEERAAAAAPSDLQEELGKGSVRLPVILYFHGGGFVVGSAATCIFHQICCKISAQIGAVVVSVAYRLAPEHKLPAAFDDSMEALNWLRRHGILHMNSNMQHSSNDQLLPKQLESEISTLADPWVSKYADFSSCFMMGHSAGGTIVHQTLFRALSGDAGFHPLNIKGLIYVIPYFAGIARTQSEIEFANDTILPMSTVDACSAMALPEGADRSHPYLTFRNPETQALLEANKLPPSLVVAGGRDPLHDRQIEYVGFLRELGKEVVLLEYADYSHAMLLYPEMSREEDAEEAYSTFKQFIAKCLVNRSTSC